MNRKLKNQIGATVTQLRRAGATISVDGGNGQEEVLLDMTSNRESNRDAGVLYVERLEALLEAKAEVANDIKELKLEAKGNGHDPAALMLVVKRRMEDAEKKMKREAMEFEAEQIMTKLGMFANTPLGAAAVDAERKRHQG